MQERFRKFLVGVIRVVGASGRLNLERGTRAGKEGDERLGIVEAQQEEQDDLSRNSSEILRTKAVGFHSRKFGARYFLSSSQLRVGFHA
jgi:hypothetical protein